jgi:hypothetical protein
MTGEDERLEKSSRDIGLGSEIFAGLEPCAVKVARTVLRGRWRSNALLLPGGWLFPSTVGIRRR